MRAAVSPLTTPLLPVSRAIATRSEAYVLGDGEITRYSRHILLPEVGISGQKKLASARVLVIGAGGLGSPACLYLAAAGVGTLGLADDDVVEATNLQRQILYTEANAARRTPKLEAAATRLRDLAPNIALDLNSARVDASNVAELIARYDIVLDGTDNFATRYVVSDACATASIPYIYGSVHRFEGQVSVFYPPHGACYRCLFASPPPPGEIPSCAEAGVLGVLPGIVGTMQATEAIKLVVGIGEPLVGRLQTFHALSSQFALFRIPKNPRCALCGPTPTITRIREIASALPARAQTSKNEITAAELHALRKKHAPMILVDVRTENERIICAIADSTSIPIAEVPARMGELPRDVPMVVYCKSGGRSARVLAMLEAGGFTNARHLAGGILAWIENVDPSLPRY